MSKLYEAHNHILLQADYQNPQEHRHMAAHILVSPDADMQVTACNQTVFCRGVLIPSGFPHKIHTFGNPILVFLFDSTTTVAVQMKTLQILSAEDAAAIGSFYNTFTREETDAAYHYFSSSVLQLLGFTDAGGCVTDDRIASAVHRIRSSPGEAILCAEMAASVYLSPSRFSHLFRKQVGMTFAAYVIYQRIVHVYTGILAGKTITQAALDAGFSSSAHFSDVNRRVFGLSASTITKDLTFRKIQ